VEGTRGAFHASVLDQAAVVQAAVLALKKRTRHVVRSVASDFQSFKFQITKVVNFRVHHQTVHTKFGCRNLASHVLLHDRIITTQMIYARGFTLCLVVHNGQCVCIYVHMYVYIYIYIYMHTYMYRETRMNNIHVHTKVSRAHECSKLTWWWSLANRTLSWRALSHRWSTTGR
jgi:hypothetical protein